MPSTTPPDILRDGSYLVVRQHWVDLPEGCLICGASEKRRLRLKIRKASRFCALFGYIGMLFYFIMPAAFLRAGLCEEHGSREQQAQRLIRFVLWSALICILVSIFLRNLYAFQLGMPIAFLMITLVGFYEILRGKLLKAIHADPHYVWLDKVSPVILDQFQQVGAQAESSAPSETQ
jgi:hypothetical protein